MSKKKIFKFFSIAIGLFLSILYLVVLFVVPNVLDLNKFKPQIQQLAKESSGLSVDASNLKLVVTPLLKAGVIVENLSVKYNNDETLVTSEKSLVLLNLPRLVLQEIEIAKIELKDPVLNVALLKNGKLDVVEYLEENMASCEEEKEKSIESEFPFSFSKRMPKMKIQNYLISFADKSLDDTIKISGEILDVKNFVLDKNINIEAKGQIESKTRKHLVYDLKLDSFLPKINIQSPENEENKKEDLKIQNPFKSIINYGFFTDVKCDLKVSQNKYGKIVADGFLNIDDISYNLKNEEISDGFIDLKFKKHLIDLRSKLFVSKNTAFQSNVLLDRSRRGRVDVSVLAKQIGFESIKNIIQLLCEVCNLSYDFDSIKTNGFINADLKFSSDFKNVTSNGSFSIDDGFIGHTSVPLKIDRINSHINFNDNTLKIEDTYGFVNGSKFEMKGNISSDAFCNIDLQSETVSLRNLFEAFAPNETKQNMLFKDGTLKMSVLLKGKMKNLNPVIYLMANNINIFDRVNRFEVLLNEVVLNLKSDFQKFNGNFSCDNFIARLEDLNSNVKLKNLNMQILPDNIEIKPFYIYLNNSPISISGDIKDYSKNLSAKITGKGNLNAYDIKSLVPKEMKSFVVAKGSLPVAFEFLSNKNKHDFVLQIAADKLNNISFLTINQLLNSPSVMNVSLTIDEKDINLKDTGLYRVSKSFVLDNLQSNISQGTKILSLDGKIKDYALKSASLDNIKISSPTELTVSSEKLLGQGSKITCKSDVSIFGSLSELKLKGYFKIFNIQVPIYKFVANEINCNFNNQSMFVNSDSIDINGCDFKFDTTINNIFAKVPTLNILNVSSDNFDVDKLFAAIEPQQSSSTEDFSNGPSSTTSCPLDLPLKIINGKMRIQKFKMGELMSSNISGDFSLNNNLFSLKNISADLYGGNISGDVGYNLSNLNVLVNVMGSNINANPLITAFIGIKDQLRGNLDFQSNLTLQGSTYQQQMKSLDGKVVFSVENGQFGDLGKFEHFINAQNILSQAVTSTALGQSIQALTPQNSASFDSLQGNVEFSSGKMKINEIISKGSNMSLLVTGDFGLLNNVGNIEVLGRVSSGIVSSLGPIADMSVSGLVSHLGQFGSVASSLLNKYNLMASEEILKKVPPLSREDSDSRCFTVLINGDVYSPKSVKTFKWLMSENDAKSAQSTFSEFNLKMNLDEVKQNVKESVESNVKNIQTQLQTTIEQKKNSVLDKLNETKQQHEALKNSILDKLNEKKQQQPEPAKNSVVE